MGWKGGCREVKAASSCPCLIIGVPRWKTFSGNSANWWGDLLQLGSAGGGGEGAGDIEGQSGTVVGALQCPGDPHHPTGAAAPLKLLGLALGTDVVPVLGTGDENQ